MESEPIKFSSPSSIPFRHSSCRRFLHKRMTNWCIIRIINVYLKNLLPPSLSFIIRCCFIIIREFNCAAVHIFTTPMKIIPRFTVRSFAVKTHPTIHYPYSICAAAKTVISYEILKSEAESSHRAALHTPLTTESISMGNCYTRCSESIKLECLYTKTHDFSFHLLFFF